ncbi:MAG: hypothetical protein MZV65_54250 [Chromatiales bacterium]|nr:hypothetical protein [Chromatiales bacterium]
MGSQIANIQHVQAGMQRGGALLRRAARSSAPGARCVNVGGGLGVDYEGTRSRELLLDELHACEEYAHNVVHALWEICAERNLPHPDIV